MAPGPSTSLYPKILVSVSGFGSSDGPGWTSPLFHWVRKRWDFELSCFTNWILSHVFLHLLCMLGKGQLPRDSKISKKSLPAFPTDASPVVELHHGPGMAFYSSHLCSLNTPVVLSAWRGLGLQRRKLYFQLSCRPASGLWGINFIVFFLFLCILHFGFEMALPCQHREVGGPWNLVYCSGKLFHHLPVPKAYHLFWN